MSLTKQQEKVLEGIVRQGAVPEAMQVLQKPIVTYFQADLKAQLSKIVAAGIPTVAGMTEAQFRDMAKDLLKPEEGQDNYLIVVGPKLLNPYQFMKHLVYEGKAGENYLYLPALTDVVEGIITPNQYLYLIYDVEDAEMLNISPVDCLKEFKKQGRRGGAWFEGCSLVLQTGVQVLDTEKGGHFMDLPGSRYESDDVPCLGRWFDRPTLSAHWSDYAFPGYGSVSCRS